MTIHPSPPSATVRPAALAERAVRVSVAVAALDPASLGAAARLIAAATPGSRSSAAAVALAGRWESAVRAWAADAAGHGAALERSARDHAETDRDVAAALRAVP